VWIFRVAVFVLPAIVHLLTKRICEELRDTDWHPLRGPAGPTVARTPTGGFAPTPGAAPVSEMRRGSGSDSA
jgi:hypothetical protein